MLRDLQRLTTKGTGVWFGPPHKSGVCRLPTSPSLGSVPPLLLPRAQVEVAVLRAWQGGREGQIPESTGFWSLDSCDALCHQCLCQDGHQAVCGGTCG